MEPILLLLGLAVLLVPIGVLYLLVQVSSLKQRNEDFKARLFKIEMDLVRLEERRAEQTRSFETEKGKPVAAEPEVSVQPESISAEPEIPAAIPPAIPLIPPKTPWTPRPPIPAEAPEMPAATSVENAEPVEPAPNLEQFLGAKLFAWVGGLALFLGIAFFVRYSFEHNLIPPAARVLLGMAIGVGLAIGGVVMRRKEYSVTSQTLCATGVVILYASTFAASGRYHLIGSIPAFVVMALITASAFLLAVRLDAQVVALLGLLGGFLTPPLLSTGQDNPLGLFGYITLLDIGLLALVFRKRWDYLMLLAAAGTIFLQFGWVAKFFVPEKLFTADAIFIWFNVLFTGAYLAARKREVQGEYLPGATISLPVAAIVFAFTLLSNSQIAGRPGALLSLVFVADICLLALPFADPRLSKLPTFSGIIMFAFLGAWTSAHFLQSNLWWMLGADFLFACLHSVLPIVLQRTRPEVKASSFGHLFPPIALLVTLVPLVRFNEISFFLWPFILLIDLVAFAVALISGALLSLVGVIIFTAVVAFFWISKMPAQIPDLPIVLLVIGAFAVFFFTGAIWTIKKLAARGFPAGPHDLPIEKQLPALSAILPFLLLTFIALRFHVADPSEIFGMALFLLFLLLGLALVSGFDAIAIVSLVATVALEFSWHESAFNREHPTIPLIWFVGFYLLFTVIRFVFHRRTLGKFLFWASAALAGPLHFFLIYNAASALLPKFGYMGLIPAALALPPLAGLIFINNNLEVELAEKTRTLAWFGGSALFFITLIFPIQFERQWLTIAWALEGMGLLWLFRRLPYRGLIYVALALLGITFVRLGTNPDVLHYYARSSTRIFNWYLYTYGIVSVAFFISATLCHKSQIRLQGRSPAPALYTFGAILAFLLLNIEIADYFATGEFLTFEFSGNFGRDMTYSIAWALFALVLLLLGMNKHAKGARYAAIGLIGVTLLKLFFHDLSQLAQLYRIGALVGVAIILMIASFLYQRFIAAQNQQKEVS